MPFLTVDAADEYADLLTAITAARSTIAFYRDRQEYLKHDSSNYGYHERCFCAKIIAISKHQIREYQDEIAALVGGPRYAR